MEKYLEYLESEFKKSVEEFEKVKKEVAEEILTMNHFTAQDFGAAYASHIDKVTVAATKVRTLADSLNAYKYFANKN